MTKRNNNKVAAKCAEPFKSRICSFVWSLVSYYENSAKCDNKKIFLKILKKETNLQFEEDKSRNVWLSVSELTV